MSALASLATNLNTFANTAQKQQREPLEQQHKHLEQRNN